MLGNEHAGDRHRHVGRRQYPPIIRVLKCLIRGLINGFSERLAVVARHDRASSIMLLKSFTPDGVSRITSRPASTQRFAHSLAAVWPPWSASLSIKIVRASTPARTGKDLRLPLFRAAQAGCSKVPCSSMFSAAASV